MTNMKLLQYAYDAAITKWYRYDKIANQYKDHRAETLARKLADETYEDVKAIAKMIQAEEKTQKLSAEVIAELKNLVTTVIEKAPQGKAPQKEQREVEQMAQKEAQRQQSIKEAPYVIVIKWRNPILGKIEFPCKNREEAEKAFEAAKREVHNGNMVEAHVYEQSDGERYPVMGIIS